MYVPDRVLTSRLDNISNETQRETAMAQQASDIEVTINNMLPASRGAENLIKIIQTMIVAQETENVAAATANTSAST
jgi:hypothetical protein